LYFPRFDFVHIASIPSSNQINCMESQTIHIIQLLCGPTLRTKKERDMDMAEKLSITLPADMVTIIKEQVRSGSYASTSEVLREAMHTWLRQDEEHVAWMDGIRSRIQQSLSDPRPSVPIGDVFERLETRFQHDAS